MFVRITIVSCLNYDCLLPPVQLQPALENNKDKLKMRAEIKKKLTRTKYLNGFILRHFFGKILKNGGLIAFQLCRVIIFIAFIFTYFLVLFPFLWHMHNLWKEHGNKLSQKVMLATNWKAKNKHKIHATLEINFRF